MYLYAHMRVSYIHMGERERERERERELTDNHSDETAIDTDKNRRR